VERSCFCFFLLGGGVGLETTEILIISCPA